MRMEPNQPAIVGKDAIRASLQKYFDQYADEGRTLWKMFVFQGIWRSQGEPLKASRA